MMPVNIKKSPTQVIRALLAIRSDAVADLTSELNDLKMDIQLLMAELKERGEM